MQWDSVDTLRHGWERGPHCVWVSLSTSSNFILWCYQIWCNHIWIKVVALPCFFLKLQRLLCFPVKMLYDYARLPIVPQCRKLQYSTAHNGTEGDNFGFWNTHPIETFKLQKCLLYFFKIFWVNTFQSVKSYTLISQKASKVICLKINFKIWCELFESHGFLELLLNQQCSITKIHVSN